MCTAISSNSENNSTTVTHTIETETEKTKICINQFDMRCHHCPTVRKMFTFPFPFASRVFSYAFSLREYIFNHNTMKMRTKIIKNSNERNSLQENLIRIHCASEYDTFIYRKWWWHLKRYRLWMEFYERKWGQKIDNDIQYTYRWYGDWMECTARKQDVNRQSFNFNEKTKNKGQNTRKENPLTTLWNECVWGFPRDVKSQFIVRFLSSFLYQYKWSNRTIGLVE